MAYLAQGKLEKVAIWLIESRSHWCPEADKELQTARTLSLYKRYRTQGKIHEELDALYELIGPPLDFTLAQEVFPSTVCISKTIEYERYVLSKLGYNGPLLEEKVVQKPGWTYDPTTHRTCEGSFDQRIAENHVMLIQRDIAEKMHAGGSDPIFGIDWYEDEAIQSDSTSHTRAPALH